MTILPHSSPMPAADRAESDAHEAMREGIKPLIDLAGIDLSARRMSRQDIERYNPHRGEMALLDGIVWTSDDYRLGVAHKRVRHDEFWVPGHFPSKPMFPGVLMVEAGAQLACFLYNIRQAVPKVVAFLRIEDCSFRAMVQPGDDLLIVCREVKFGRRQFESDMQTLVNGKITCSARISGMSLPTST